MMSSLFIHGHSPMVVGSPLRPNHPSLQSFRTTSTDAVILGRNVGSPGTLAQIVGRGMRSDVKNKKSDVLLLNYSGQKGSDVRDLVFNQVKGPRGQGIDCKVDGKSGGPVSLRPRPSSEPSGSSVNSGVSKKDGGDGGQVSGVELQQAIPKQMSRSAPSRSSSRPKRPRPSRTPGLSPLEVVVR